MSDYCESCGCRQEDSQFSNLHHYTNCPNAPGGAILHLKRRDQDERNAKEDEIERLKARIEELERPRDPDDPIGTEHYITTEQIDLAWDQRREAYGKAWLRADYFGIERCEGCDDSLKPGTVFKMDMGERGYITDCPDCAKYAGHGWKIGGGDG